MVLYAFLPHFKKTNEMVLINKYMYQVIYAEPSHDDPKRAEKLDDVHYGSTRFIGKYLMKASLGSKVTSSEMSDLIQEEFPGLIAYMMDNSVDGGRMPRPLDGVVDFDRWSYHLDVLLPLDWLALYQTAELEEKRRGLAIR